MWVCYLLCGELGFVLLFCWVGLVSLLLVGYVGGCCIAYFVFFCVITGYCCLGVCVLDLLFGCVGSFVGLDWVYVVWRCGLVGAF